MTCLYFAWPFRVPGWFPAWQKCVSLYVEFVHFVLLHITSRMFLTFQMNKIWDVMLLKYKLRFFSAAISKYQIWWFLVIDQCTCCARRSLTFCKHVNVIGHIVYRIGNSKISTWSNLNVKLTWCKADDGINLSLERMYFVVHIAWFKVIMHN